MNHLEQDRIVLYSSLLVHNNSDMRTALRNLNSGSCDRLTDPLEKTASRGFYFDGGAGSIIFGDSYILGESE